MIIDCDREEFVSAHDVAAFIRKYHEEFPDKNSSEILTASRIAYPLGSYQNTYRNLFAD